MTLWHSLMASNDAAFLAINAPAHPDAFTLALAKFCANDIIYFVPLALVWLWLRGEPDRRAGLFLGFLAAILALLGNQVIGMFYYHPRPFAAGLGHLFIPHAADSSFPSDHLTFMASIALGLAFWGAAPRTAMAIAIAALPVAWARIYLGVHYPLDMIGAVCVALAAVLVIAPFRRVIQARIMPGMVEPLYHLIFGFAIRRGWARGDA